MNELGATVGLVRLDLGGQSVQTVDPGSVPSLLLGFSGSAVVESGHPVAASVLEEHDGMNALSYAGISAGAERAFVPLIFDAYNGWSTGRRRLQNLHDTAVPITITYRRRTAMAARGRIGRYPPLGSVGFFQPGNTDLPTDFVGSALVEGPPVFVHCRRGDRAAPRRECRELRRCAGGKSRGERAPPLQGLKWLGYGHPGAERGRLGGRSARHLLRE